MGRLVAILSVRYPRDINQLKKFDEKLLICRGMILQLNIEVEYRSDLLETYRVARKPTIRKGGKISFGSDFVHFQNVSC